jgi:hypothetical protein
MRGKLRLETKYSMRISTKLLVFRPEEVIQIWVNAERVDDSKQRIHLHFFPFATGVIVCGYCQTYSHIEK